MPLLYVFHRLIARCYSKDNKKTSIQRKVEGRMKKILEKVNVFLKEYYESFAEEPVL